MTSGKKYTIATIVFYGIMVLLIFVGRRYSHSGPCNPGLGDLLFLLMVPVSAIGFVACVANRLLARRAWMGPMLINGAVLLALILLIETNRF